MAGIEITVRNFQRHPFYFSWASRSWNSSARGFVWTITKKNWEFVLTRDSFFPSFLTGEFCPRKQQI
jgi:hypothetical protein